MHAAQDVLRRASVADLHTVIGEVAPGAHADKKLVGTTVVDDVPGVVPEYFDPPSVASGVLRPPEEQLCDFPEGSRRGEVGEVQRVNSIVPHREEAETRVGERKVELVVLDVRRADFPGHDVRVAHPGPPPVPGFYAVQNNSAGVRRLAGMQQGEEWLSIADPKLAIADAHISGVALGLGREDVVVPTPAKDIAVLQESRRDHSKRTVLRRDLEPEIRRFQLALVDRGESLAEEGVGSHGGPYPGATHQLQEIPPVVKPRQHLGARHLARTSVHASSFATNPLGASFPTLLVSRLAPRLPCSPRRGLVLRWFTRPPRSSWARPLRSGAGSRSRG